MLAHNRENKLLEIQMYANTTLLHRRHCLGFKQITQACSLSTHLARHEVKLGLLHISLLLGSQSRHLVFFLPPQKQRLGCLVGCGFTGRKRRTITTVKGHIHHILRSYRTATLPQQSVTEKYRLILKRFFE